MAKGQASGSGAIRTPGPIGSSVIISRTSRPLGFTNPVSVNGISASSRGSGVRGPECVDCDGRE